MSTALVLGAGCGVGLWALAVWLFPARPALGAVLKHSTTVPAPAPILAADDTGWAAKLGRPFIAPLRALGLPGTRLTRDLAVIGRPVATHLAEKATLAIAGLLLPVLAHLLLALARLSLGVAVPILGGLMLAAAGFVLPDLQARSEAAKLRTGFRHALSAYLDLVWITLAGGAGVDSALNDSVAIGRGWAFEQIRRALDTARLTRTTPWATLRQLGEELDVTELSELAASVSLAGTEGAKVRTSLAAKAGTLRTHQLTDAEGEAQAATERMSLPVMALFLGFLAFIAYPALTQVLNGL
ncbi:type II secretion system F family protein [Amycolatopsis taiwanensis]|uniref:Membrane protein n=1 Tax=Amycolatopsis taiwanensis TaxID=342230 RepID=A0A9W6R8N0_9PSEU|nr:type II secretion system F family protein [Amycolatopsis taiwanensis]GLY71374.1 membrane protein [Amycolatopsis taiwanensis]